MNQELLKMIAIPEIISFYEETIISLHNKINNIPSGDLKDLFFVRSLYGPAKSIDECSREISNNFRKEISDDFVFRSLLRKYSINEIEILVQEMCKEVSKEMYGYRNIKARDIITDDMLSQKVLDIEKEFSSKKTMSFKDLKTGYLYSNKGLEDYRIVVEGLSSYGSKSWSCFNWSEKYESETSQMQVISNMLNDIISSLTCGLTNYHDSSLRNGYGSPYSRYCYEYLLNKYYNLDIGQIDLSNHQYVMMLLSNNYIDSYKFSTYMIEEAIQNSFSGPYMEIYEKYKYYINYKLLDKSLLKKIDKSFIIKNSLEEKIYSIAPYLFIDDMLASRHMKIREMAVDNLPRGDKRLEKLLNEKTFTLLLKVVTKAPVECIPFVLGNLSKLKEHHSSQVRDLLKSRMEQEDCIIDYNARMNSIK